MRVALLLVVALAALGQARVLDAGGIKAMVDGHNAARAAVGMPPLRWSDALAQSASNFVARCPDDHDTDELDRLRQGENLFWSSESNRPDSYLATQAVDQRMADTWASERKFYDERTGDCSGGECGHWTQMVWGETTEVGCAINCGGNRARSRIMGPPKRRLVQPYRRGPNRPVRLPTAYSMSDMVMISCRYKIAGNMMGERYNTKVHSNGGGSRVPPTDDPNDNGNGNGNGNGWDNGNGNNGNNGNGDGWDNGNEDGNGDDRGENESGQGNGNGRGNGNGWNNGGGWAPPTTTRRPPTFAPTSWSGPVSTSRPSSTFAPTSWSRPVSTSRPPLHYIDFQVTDRRETWKTIAQKFSRYGVTEDALRQANPGAVVRVNAIIIVPLATGGGSGGGIGIDVGVNGGTATAGTSTVQTSRTVFTSSTVTSRGNLIGVNVGTGGGQATAGPDPRAPTLPPVPTSNPLTPRVTDPAVEPPVVVPPSTGGPRGPRVHTVARGDTYFALARKYYPTESAARGAARIQAANGSKALSPGVTVIIP